MKTPFLCPRVKFYRGVVRYYTLAKVSFRMSERLVHSQSSVDSARLVVHRG